MVGVEKMNDTRKLFLDILKASLCDQQIDPDREISADEWQRIFQMASIHNVVPMVYEAVYASQSLRRANLPYLPAIRHHVIQEVMQQTMRTEEFLILNQKLQDAGIKPLVVKGLICRNLYPKPDNRQSSDEDVLIPEEQFEACHRILLGCGMHTTAEESRLLTDYEIPYQKAGSSLYIELHKQLFPPESDAYGDMNSLFGEVFDRAVAEEIQGGTVYTMDYTDHLFYLLCHAFKHFLHSGFGIRQVCDIILYANEYGSQIDWIQVLGNCRKIRADRFAAAIFAIGSNYLVFDPEKAAYPREWRKIRVDALPMLDDLLSGGTYGGAEMSRMHSRNITLDAVAAQKQGRKAKNTLVAVIFPSAARLSGRYPYLKKHAWLLPVAWISRILAYSRGIGQTQDTSAAEALKIGSERVELMKKYGIL